MKCLFEYLLPIHLLQLFIRPTLRYSECTRCKRRGVQHYCPEMYSWKSRGTSCRGFMLCNRCVKVDLDDRLRTAADPKNHETCLVCDPGSSLSVMVTQDAVTSPPFQSSEHKGLQQQQQGAPVLLPGDTVDALSKEKLDAAVSAAALTGVRLGLVYTITVELWLPSLPPPNQKQALLRFSPPPPR